MPCDTRLKRNQTVAQRKAEVKEDVKKVDKLVVQKKVKVVVGPQGAVAFTGLSEAQRDGMTDVCIYNAIMATGSMAAKIEIQRAEQAAGRLISKTAVRQGLHSHDGGQTWHPRG